MIDKMIVSAVVIDNIKITIEEMNILLINICYILKLEVNLMSMSKFIYQNFIFKQLIYNSNYTVFFISSDRTFFFIMKLNNNDIYKMKKLSIYKNLIQFILFNSKFESVNMMINNRTIDMILILLNNNIKIVELIITQ